MANFDTKTNANLLVLAQELECLGVPTSYYSLGVNRNERTCLVFSGEKWLVYYSERGQREGLKEFKNYEDARLYLLSSLQ